VTGFRRFGRFLINPTERLMHAIEASTEPISGVLVRAMVLDTSYDACERQLEQAIADFSPDAIVSFGLNNRADEIRLERLAVNVDDARLPDNDGDERNGQRIAEQGPPAYWSTLPLEAVYQALTQEVVPVGFSNHAGAYVCNHVFYYGRHLVETRGQDVLVGFVHVPPLPEQLTEEEAVTRKGMDLETLLRAARICIAAIGLHLGVSAGDTPIGEALEQTG
jgi:pyroglutamyl-peptidase